MKNSRNGTYERKNNAVVGMVEDSLRRREITFERV